MDQKFEDQRFDIRINYDDQLNDIIAKINKSLYKFDLKIHFDNEEHDGFELLAIRVVE